MAAFNANQATEMVTIRTSIAEDFTMRDMKLNDWMNLVAAFGVLAGLILVAIELKQTNDIAQAETIRALWYEDNDLDKFGLANGMLPLARKADEQPLELTDDEIERLDAFLTIQMQHQLTVSLMRNEHNMALSSTEAQAADIVDDHLAGRFGRGWFAANEYWLAEYHPGLVAAIKRELANTPVEIEHTWPSEIRESVRRVVENEQRAE